MQILQTSIKPRKISKIFLTHLHGDHLFGLPGLLSSRSFQGGEDNDLTPLDIYGPQGVKNFVTTALKISGTKINYKINFQELSSSGGNIFNDSKFSITALPLKHGVLSFGYRIVETDHEGELQAQELIKLGVPNGPLFGKLKRGETVTLSNGQIINGQDFLGEKKKGRIITIIGDTRKCQNAIKLAQNADLLVHEATFDQNQNQQAYNYFHSTTTQAAEVAQAAQVKKLALTHYSARYQNSDLPYLRQQAQKVFKNTVTVHDLDEIKVDFS
jgi:ribonuclease Z